MALPALVSRDNPGAFGPFNLVEQLGQGGMAIVYRAQQRGAASFARDVVLKAMLPALVKSAPLVEMFETEARLTAQLRHPNIVQVEDYGVANGIPYLIMEFLDGRNLSQLRNALNKQKRRVPIAVAVTIIRDLCHALGYAHHFLAADGQRMQVIHRDISPSNVMVLRDGSVRLLDFGVAKLSSEAGQAVTTSLKGKFAYMAPEQVNQEPIDRRCDVFAAGIVLHELLTGRRLFGTKSELETLRRVSLAEAVPPSLTNEEVPPALDAIVMRALSRAREDRYDSGTEMAAALESLGIAAPRRELASLIGQFFPLATAQRPEALTAASEVDGDTDVSGGKLALDGVTSPEHAVSAPHLVLLPGDAAIVADLPDERSMSQTGGGEIEFEAEPSGSHLAGAATGTYRARVNPEDDRGARPTKKAMAVATSMPQSETVAAPLDEIRPTRIYDPSQPATTVKAPAEGDFEARPTKVYDTSLAETMDGPAPGKPALAKPALAKPLVTMAPSSTVDVDPELSATSGARTPRIDADLPGVAPEAPVGSVSVEPESGFEIAPVPTQVHQPRDRHTVLTQPTGGFDAAPVVTPPPPAPRRTSLFLIGGVLGALAIVVTLGVRAFVHGGVPAFDPRVLAPANGAGIAARELAAPTTAEPRLPPALPPPISAETGVSLVGLDRKPNEKRPLGKEPKPDPSADAKIATKPVANLDDKAETPTAAKPVSKTRSDVKRATRPAAKAEARPEPKPAKAKGTVKEGRIVDPFEDGE